MIIKKEDFEKKAKGNHNFAAEAGERGEMVYLCTNITYIIKHCLKNKLDEFQILTPTGAGACYDFMNNIDELEDDDNIDRLNDIYQLCENSLYLYHEFNEMLAHLEHLEHYKEE